MTLPITLAIIAAFALLAHWTPLFVGRNLFFGITVGTAFRSTDAARAILRRYRLFIWSAAFLGAGLAMALHPVAGFILQILLSLVAFAGANRQASPHHVEPSPVRVAALAGRRLSWAERPLWLFGPVLLVALTVGAGILLKGSWDALMASSPEKPVSFAMGAVCGSCIAVVGLRYGSRRNTQPGLMDMRTLVLTSSLLSSYIFALYAAILIDAGVFGYVLSDQWGRRVAFALVGLVVVHFVLMYRRAYNSDVQDVTPDRCWKWGLFYYNPDDPAIMVAKRSGPGYTMNFARPLTWIAFAAFVAIMILPALLK